MGIGRRASARISTRQGIPALAAVIGVASAAAIVTSITSPANSLAAANPISGSRSAIVFPQRDFVSLDGYVGDTVVVHVKHDPAVYGNLPEIVSEPATAQTDTGLIEINHPGGFCWVGNTPDIRPGDLVTVHVTAGPDAGLVDEGTEVANVTNKRPVQTAPNEVQIHGTASDLPTLAGAPIPIAQLEQRLVAPGSLFDASGKRTMRAAGAGGGQGTIAYDAPGSLNWTATYTGLSADDVKLAMSAESRIAWLGAVAAPALESTIYENGPLTLPGPAAPCTAPLEVLPPPAGSELVPPSDPTNLTASLNSTPNTVTLNWTASTDNVGVTAYGIFRDGQNIATVSNADGSANPPTTYVDGNLPPGTYTWTVNALDEVGNVSGMSNTAGPLTTVIQLDVNTFPVNEPPSLPVNIIVFPSRDFISPSGYLGDDLVTVQVLRKNAAGALIVVSSADGIVPNAEGFAEVNHPGGACWLGITPELRTGDIVRTIAFNPANVGVGNPTGIRTIDQTTVAGVTTFRPVVVTPATPGLNDGVVQIHGTALGHDGRPIPVDQLEQRMIATHGVGLWDLNGRRALRASAVPQDGSLSYDTANNPLGINWTATYTGLDSADVARMADADTRGHWLGQNPLTLAEATIMENADTALPGPSAPLCTSPLEAADVTAPSAPTNAVASAIGNQVTISWTKSSDNWTVAGYRIEDNGTPVANTAAGVTTVALSPVAPGPHSYTVRAFDTASPRGAGADIATQIIAGFGNPYGNLSAPSNVATTTSLDVIPPTKPTGLSVVTSPGQVVLTWSPSTDDVGVTNYVVHRTPAFASDPSTGTTTTYTDSGLAAGAYTYTVTAYDLAGNNATSLPVTANVTAVLDTQAPTAPPGVTATTNPDVHGRNILVSWSASTDNIGVAAYEIHRAGFGAATPGPLLTTVNGSTLSYIDANLPAGTYTYTVVAKDSAGNVSPDSAPATAVVANDPPLAPHGLIAFPARDFLSATGYDPAHLYVFTVLRGGVVVFTSNPQAPDATGTVEVNHPGGACWLVNTPNLRPGDVVRITDASTGVPEQTTIANVTAERPIATAPGTVTIHGTAQDAAGLPLPIDQIEQRLIANRDLFEKNGKRTLRAGAGLDGTLTYDAPGSIKWTATYTGLSAKDVIRAVGGVAADGTVFVGAESRGHWLGRAPLALVETTIFENGPGVVGGPPGAPDCITPLEPNQPAVSFTPANLTLNSFGLVRFAPAPATSGNQTVTIFNSSNVPLRVTNVYFAGANPGDFLRTGGTCVGNAFTIGVAGNCTVTVAFKPSALGLRQGFLAFSDDAANTTDQAIALTGTGGDSSLPLLSATPNPLAFGTVTAAPGGVSRTIAVTNPSVGLPPGGTLAISGLSITGGVDFSATAGAGCNAVLPNSASTCTITVTFKPTSTAARTASLIISHNALQGGTTSTVVPLTATGVGSVLTWGTTSVKFGTVKRATTVTQTVSLKNSGNRPADLTGTPFTVTGDPAFRFVSSTCGTSLAVNGSCNVVVSYTAPNAAVNTTAATLTVTAPNGMPTAVSTSLSASVK